MAKCQIWWKTLWENMWEDGGLVANKPVEKQNSRLFCGDLLWNYNCGGGINEETCANRCHDSGKRLQISKLFKSDISTIST